MKVRLLGKTLRAVRLKISHIKNKKKNNNQEIRATICKKKKKNSSQRSSALKERILFTLTRKGLTDAFSIS